MNMRLLAATAVALCVAAPAAAQSIEITPTEARPSEVGSPQFFTGHVVIDPLVPATDHTRATGFHVNFAPGSRSAWHSHPAGQFLIVTSGTGWVQERGGERRQINPGDVIWTPPGVEHWHGAAGETSMSHIALQELVDGSAVEWLEHVTEEQYRSGASSGGAGSNDPPSVSTPDDLGAVSPALERYRRDVLMGDLWQRPDLSPRDRSIVTLSALIARELSAELQDHVELALENGVRPAEISEIVTHLAFYAGWGNAWRR